MRQEPKTRLRKAKPAERTIQLKDAAHILGVPIEVLPRLVRTVGCKIAKDRWLSPCISFEDFSKLHDHPAIVEVAERAALNEAELRVRDGLSGANERFAKEIKETLLEYRQHIRVLAEIHPKYLARLRPLQKKTPLAAAYLLYARVINLLNMGCVCLEASYWNAGVVLRQIDEAIQVAEYFSSTDPNPGLEKDAARWFRENRSPQPKKMREADAARLEVHLGSEQSERHLYVLDELYEKKSKWIHPTFSPVRETLQTQPQGGQAVIIGFDYGPSTYPRKLHEITLFYRSSIWTAVQGFLLCFQEQIPLEASDAERLLALDRKFTNEPDGL